MEIIGVGFAEASWTSALSSAEGFPFELWTDTYRTLALYYGAVLDHADPQPERFGFLLGKDGAVMLEYRDSPETGPGAADLLHDVQTVFGPCGE